MYGGGNGCCGHHAGFVPNSRHLPVEKITLVGFLMFFVTPNPLNAPMPSSLYDKLLIDP